MVLINSLSFLLYIVATVSASKYKELPTTKPECPKATDFCRQGFSLIKASSPHAPLCWANTSNGWTCYSKQDGKCKASEADITTCNITAPITPPTCPKESDYCVSGDIAYFAKDPLAPPCWAKEDGKFLCFSKINGKCDASKGEKDITTCNSNPPTKPACPKATDLCKKTYHFIKANSPHAPPCWGKSNDEWTCFDKQDKSCRSGEADITTCNITAPIVPPTCPKGDDFCQYTDILFRAKDPGAPPCWAKEDGKFLCFYKANGNCNSSLGEKDIATCKFY